MHLLTPESLGAYWSVNEISVNIIIFLNLLGALLLGCLVGYERAYHGRAAGMRTYGLVCMASAALTVLSGYPQFWYGGHAANMAAADPTRTIQGIVTGIGFLGAGVIMKDGFSISGLTTAASLWASSAIGVMVGVGFYATAILLTILSAACMMWGARLEGWLPSHPAIAVSIRFKSGIVPQVEVLRRLSNERGYTIAGGSFSVAFEDGQSEWRFVAIVQGKRKAASLTDLSNEISKFEGVQSFNISHARN